MRPDASTATVATPEPRTFAETIGITPERLKDLLAKQRRREQRRRRKVPLPPPRPERPEHPLHVLGSDGRLCVSVRLVGDRGSGKRVIVDAIDWTRVVREHGDRWRLKEVRPGYSYAVGAGQANGTYLARIIAKAGKGQTVGFRDGNSLNLARGNLDVMGDAEARRKALGH